MATKQSTKKPRSSRPQRATRIDLPATPGSSSLEMEPSLSREAETVKKTRKRTRKATKLADVSTSSSKKRASSSLPESQAEGSTPTKKRSSKTTKSTASLSSTKEQATSSRLPEEVEDSGPAKKRTRKALNKKERQALVNYISEVDVSMLSDIVYTKLSEQCLPNHLQKFTDAL